MSQYTEFSNVYDLFMDNVPYEKWSDKIENILKENGINDGIVLDLGCGTGTLTELMARKGYDMIGIDSSEDMLAEAIEKKPENLDILYLNQDFTCFELYGTVRAVVSTCDSLNYLTDPEDLVDTFKLINNYLDPDGVFIFDMNAPEKYSNVLSDNVYAENREDASFIWENTYDEESRINEYALTLYIEDDETGLYERCEEYHYQRAYLREEIEEILKKAGFNIIHHEEEDMRLFYTAKVADGCKLGNTGMRVLGE